MPEFAGRGENIQDKNTAAQFYITHHQNHFVVVITKTRDKVMGILSCLTPDNNLYVVGDTGAWSIDPLTIKKFYGREDRKRDGGGGQNG